MHVDCQNCKKIVPPSICLQHEMFNILSICFSFQKLHLLLACIRINHFITNHDNKTNDRALLPVPPQETFYNSIPLNLTHLAAEDHSKSLPAPVSSFLPSLLLHLPGEKTLPFLEVPILDFAIYPVANNQY
mmetsp:Transcript_7721/g.14566  ORF Transcript_7721/g.14566 Transcript_7721/m.14566 type:complete len:131 (+) Transcript_7721:268-660(+)